MMARKKVSPKTKSASPAASRPAVKFRRASLRSTGVFYHRDDRQQGRSAPGHRTRENARRFGVEGSLADAEPALRREPAGRRPSPRRAAPGRRVRRGGGGRPRPAKG